MLVAIDAAHTDLAEGDQPPQQRHRSRLDAERDLTGELGALSEQARQGLHLFRLLDDLVGTEGGADHREPPVGTRCFNSSNQLRTTLSRAPDAVSPVSPLPAGTVTRNLCPKAVTRIPR